MPKNLLTEREVAALFALYHAASGSIHSHIPQQAILARFRKDYRGYVADGLADLVRHPEKYAMKHPTRGEMTYQITMAGVNKLQELRLL
jgi:hypothetical protein